MDYFGLGYFAVAVCYVLECFVPVPGAAVLFTRSWGRVRVLRLPGRVFLSRRLALLGLLPWSGEWHIAPSPACTLTRAGIITVNSLHPQQVHSPAPEVLDAASANAAPYLEELTAAGYDCRADIPARAGSSSPAPAKSAGLAAWVDPAPVRARLAPLHQELFALNLLCTLQFFWVFVAVPAFLPVYSLEGALWPALVVMYWISGCIAARFAFTFRRLHGKGPRTLARTLWVLVYPPAAMRSVQALCRNLAPACHESALADALMNKGHEKRGLRRIFPFFVRPGQSGSEQGRAHPDRTLSARGREYLQDILDRLEHQPFARSLPEGAHVALKKADKELGLAIARSWGMPDKA